MSCFIYAFDIESLSLTSMKKKIVVLIWRYWSLSIEPKIDVVPGPEVILASDTHEVKPVFGFLFFYFLMTLTSFFT